MTDDAGKRDLLYGLLALELELIVPSEFVKSMRRWVAAPERPLHQVLIDSKLITDDDHAAIEHVVGRHLERHQQDLDKSLAGVSVQEQVAEALSLIEHPAVQSSLNCVSLDDTRPVDATARVDPAETIAMDSSNTGTVTSPPPVPGDRFQRLRPHAKGGLGEVHVALDHELGREVALKQIQSKFVDNGINRQRFQFEAEITGRLEHPGIVPVYSAGTDGDGAPYYAMRLVRGQSLDDVIEGYHQGSPDRIHDTLGLRRLLNCLLSACHAVAYAHSQGVLHRDIKPQNIMVGKFGETFVVDWGLAKRLGEAADPVEGPVTPAAFDAETVATQPGATLGTPAFMSPEQAEGKLKLLSPASDVYSLGATLYTILTGRMAFEQRDLGDVLTAVRHGMFVAPRTRNASVSQPLNAICMKAMATDPADRYPSPEHLGDDLERWLAGEPVEAWPEPWTIRARRWTNRHRTLVVTSAVALVVAAVGLAAVAAVQSRANQELFATNSVLETTNHDLIRTSSQLENANTRLTDANTDLEVARDRALARADLAIQAIERVHLAVDENLDVKNRPDLTSVRDALIQSPREFYEAFKEELLESTDTAPETRLRLARVYNRLGDLSRLVSSQSGAMETYKEAALILTDLRDQDPDNVAYLDLLAEIRNNMGGIYLDSQEQPKALPEYAAVREIRERIIELEPENLSNRSRLGNVCYNQAIIHSIQGKLDLALETLNYGHGFLDEVLRQLPDDREARNTMVRICEMLGQAHLRKGQPAVARDVLESAIPLAASVVEDEPESIRFRQSQSYVHQRLASVYMALKQTDQGLEHALRSLDIMQQLADENPTSSRVLLNLSEHMTGVTHIEQAIGKINDSISRQLEANKIVEQLIEKHPENVKYRATLAQNLLGLGSRYYMAGQSVKSIDTFRQLVPVLEELIQFDPDNVARKRSLGGVHYNIGTLLSYAGRMHEAFEAHAKAMVVRRQLVDDHPDQPELQNDLAFTLGNLAHVYDDRGEYDKALDCEVESSNIQRRLVAEYPELVNYQVSLSRTLRSMAGVLDIMGRYDEALAGYAEALELLDPLVKADPADTQGRRDLGALLSAQGKLYTETGAYDLADNAFERGVAVLDALCRDHPDEVINRRYLARSQALWTRMLVRTGRHDETIVMASQAIALVEPLVAANPQNLPASQVLRMAFLVRSEAHARAGDRVTARDDWNRSTASLPDNSAVQEDGALGDAWIALWAGDTETAVAAAEQVATGADATLRQKFAAGQILSFAAGVTGTDQAVAQNAAERALQLLKSVADAGPFTTRQRVALRLDESFDSLRKRPEFEQFLQH